LYDTLIIIIIITTACMASNQRSSTVVHALETILACRDNGDYFRMFDLEYPSVDALDRPVWNVTSEEIARAYRKASILVHPDKITTSLVQAGIDKGERHDVLCSQARDAFDALRQGRVALEDPDSLERVLKSWVDKVAKQEKEKEVARLGTVEERVEYMSHELSEKKRLREEEYLSMNEEIRLQMMEQRKRGLMKKKRHEERLQRDTNRISQEEEKDTKDCWSDGIPPENTMTVMNDEEGREGTVMQHHDTKDHDDNEEARMRRRKNQKRRRQTHKTKTDID